MPENEEYQCDNCGLIVDDDTDMSLDTIDDLSQRLDPGGVVPAGQCPECGALMYVKD